MKAILKQYYLAPFIGFVILLTINTIGIRSPNSAWENILILVIGSLLLTLIVGTIYYFLDTKWGPAKREKRFSKTPFKELLAYGFMREDKFLVGKVNGYTTIVMYTLARRQVGYTDRYAVSSLVKRPDPYFNRIERIEKKKQENERMEKPITGLDKKFSWSYNRIFFFSTQP